MPSLKFFFKLFLSHEFTVSAINLFVEILLIVLVAMYTFSLIYDFIIHIAIKLRCDPR